MSHPDDHAVYTTTVPAGTYTADGLSILLAVSEDEVGRLMAAAVRRDLAVRVPAGWRLPLPLEVDVAHPA